MASVAVLPVLVGLSVDYAIQFQSRVQEARADGAVETLEAIRQAALHGVPTIATAVLASIGGLLVLMLSPVPMVRGFGLLLVVGVAIAFLCALTAGSAALVLADRSGARRTRGSARQGGAGPGEGEVGSKNPVPPRARTPLRGTSGGHALFGMLAEGWQGAREILADNAASRFVSSMALDRAVRHPGRVLGIGLVLAALGWGLDTQTQVQTDISKLAPQNLSSLHNLDELERVTGVGGEIDLMVSSDSLTKLATIEWMSAYEAAILKRFGYSAAKGCGRAQLCPAFSLPDLFHQEEGASTRLTQKGVNGLLAALPPYFSEDVITRDRHVATLAFGIRLMPLQQQQGVIEAMRSDLHPPAGVSARLVGLSVLAAQAGAQIASPWRRVVTLLVALAAVALILLAAFRGDRRRALVPLAPIVLATGWSALIVFALRIPLNPMSVTLGALVIAISTEFSVLLAERHRQERLAGHSTVQALRRAYRSTGAAVAASGVTAIAGFGVLALSDIAMLRDFGLGHAGGPVCVADRRADRAACRGGSGRKRGAVAGADPPRHALAQGDRSRQAREAAWANRAMSRSGSPESPTDGGAPDPARAGDSSDFDRRRDPPDFAAGSDTSESVEPDNGSPGGIAGTRYGLYVVILAAILLIAFTIHVALNSHKGVTSIRPGAGIPPFAAPYAVGGPAGEVDVATHANDGSAGKVPACSERGPGILNICELYERGPVVLALFFQAGSCPRILDDLQRLAPVVSAGRLRRGRGQRRSLLGRALGARKAPDGAGRRRRGRTTRGALRDGQLPADHIRLSGRRGAERVAVEYAVAGQLARRVWRAGWRPRALAAGGPGGHERRARTRLVRARGPAGAARARADVHHVELAPDSSLSASSPPAVLGTSARTVQPLARCARGERSPGSRSQPPTGSSFATSDSTRT